MGKLKYYRKYNHVDSAKILNEDGQFPEEEKFLLCEIDGFEWDSGEYDSLEEMIQSIIDHAIEVYEGEVEKELEMMDLMSEIKA